MKDELTMNQMIILQRQIILHLMNCLKDLRTDAKIIIEYCNRKKIRVPKFACQVEEKVERELFWLAARKVELDMLNDPPSNQTTLKGYI